jgi:hypothetical protein
MNEWMRVHQRQTKLCNSQNILWSWVENGLTISLHKVTLISNFHTQILEKQPSAFQ